MEEFEDRRRKPIDQKLRREIQVLVNDAMFLEILEASRGKKISEWVREVIEKELAALRTPGAEKENQ